MENQITNQQRFIQLIEKCEQQQHFIEFRSVNQIQGSDARFIEVNPQNVSYQDLVDLGFHYDILNFHQIITMSNKIAIGNYLRQVFYHQSETSRQFLLLRFNFGAVIIETKKSTAIRPQLKLKIFPLSKMMTHFNHEDIGFIHQKIGQITNKSNALLTFEQLFSGNSSEYTPHVIFSEYHIDLVFYLSLIWHSQLPDTQPFDIYPIDFYDAPNQINVLQHYQKFINNWANSKKDITLLFHLYDKVSDKNIKKFIIEDIFCVILSNPNSISHGEKEIMMAYFNKSPIKDDYHDLIFFILFANEIKSYQKTQTMMISL